MVSIASRRTTKFEAMDATQRAVVFGAVVLILLLALLNQRDSAESIIAAENSLSLFDITYKDEYRVDLSPYEGCTIDPVSSPQPEGLKAYWVPMFPNSDAGIIGTIVRLLTDSPAAHKSYYAKSKGTKKCKGNSVTVTCEQIHPVVGIGPPPEQQTGRYQPKILMGIRNPITGIPAHHHTKAVKYHGATEQVDINGWRNFRDAWFMVSVRDGWRRVLTTWKDMEGYDDDPMYLPLEHLLHETKGPELTRRLADELSSAGYHVVQNTDCVWYTAVKDQLSGPNNPHYDYVKDYIPSLTKEQKDELIEEFKDVKTTYPNDISLGKLLDEYTEVVLAEERTDIPWVNKTAVP